MGPLRIRSRRAEPDAWDDDGLEAFAATVLDLAQSRGDEHGPAAGRHAATRSAVLGAFAVAGAARASTRPEPRLRRAAVVLGMAGALLAAGAVGVAASTPGLPLYGVRIAIEDAALPAPAAERAEAQLGRLDRRVDEARAAAGIGDATAVRASLEAFAQIATEASLSAKPDLQASARVAAQLAALGRIETAEPASEAARLRAMTAADGLWRGLRGGPVPTPGPGDAGAPGDSPPYVRPSVSPRPGGAPSPDGSRGGPERSKGPGASDGPGPGDGTGTGTGSGSGAGAGQGENPGDGGGGSGSGDSGSGSRGSGSGSSGAGSGSSSGDDTAPGGDAGSGSGAGKGGG